MLLNKTESLHDTAVTYMLKANYVCNVLKVLLDVKKEGKREDVIQALSKVKMWKKSVWGSISYKTKIKYYCVMLKYII